MGKLLSIIIPAYNMEQYLCRCCESIVIDDRGLMSLLDIIIVNDGSSDGTSEIAHEFERRYNGIFRVIDKQNGNYGSCINAGVDIALGKFVRVLDADDYYDKDGFKLFVSKLCQLSAACQECDVVISNYDMVDERGSLINRIDYDLPEDMAIGVKAVIPFSKRIAMHGLTYRLDLVKGIHYRQTEGISYTDNEWAIIPFMVAKTIRFLDICVYHYYIGRIGQTMRAAVDSRNIEMSAILLRDIHEMYDEISKDVTLDGQLYFRSYVGHLIGRVYSDLIWNVPIDEFISSFSSFDKMVEECYGHSFTLEIDDKLGVIPRICIAVCKKIKMMPTLIIIAVATARAYSSSRKALRKI